MTKQMPQTGITLGDAKQYLSDNFVSHTIKKTSEQPFGLYVYDVKAMEEVPELNSIRRRNFRLYSDGLEDTAKAWWESTQGPMSVPTVTPEPTFLDGVRNFIKEEVVANRIKAGELIYGDNDMERATATVIDSATNNEKYVIIKREANVFSMENYTPIKIASKGAI